MSVSRWFLLCHGRKWINSRTSQVSSANIRPDEGLHLRIFLTQQRATIVGTFSKRLSISIQSIRRSTHWTGTSTRSQRSLHWRYSLFYMWTSSTALQLYTVWHAFLGSWTQILETSPGLHSPTARMPSPSLLVPFSDARQ